jgi:ATP-binding cassette, subfamily B, multidrug efflux pump
MAQLDRQRLRRLLPYLARDRRRLLLSLVLLLPVALAAAIQPLLVGQAISVLRGEPTFAWLQTMPVASALRLLVLTLLAAVLVRLGLQGLQTYNVQAVGQRLTARIRDDLFAHAMALSLRFHDRTPVGKLLTRLTSDVDALAEVFGSGAVGRVGRFGFFAGDCPHHAEHRVAPGPAAAQRPGAGGVRHAVAAAPLPPRQLPGSRGAQPAQC